MSAPALDPAFLEHLLDTLAETVPAAARAAARIALLALAPPDPLAGMLAVQAIAAHYAVMDAFRRAAQPELADAAAARLRGNAAGLARMMQATLRALEARRDAAEPPARSQTRTLAPPCAEPRVSDPPGERTPRSKDITLLKPQHSVGLASGDVERPVAPRLVPAALSPARPESLLAPSAPG